MITRWFSAALLSVALASAAVAQSPEPPQFGLHARFRGIGACLAQAVGPGPEPGTERLYASHIYGGGTFDLVAVDPRTGRADVFPSPIPSGTETATPADYAGKEQALFRIALGPDDRLYGSTAMPIHFFSADPESARWQEIGQPGGGEFYSFLARGDVLLGAAYSALAPIMTYRPGKPYRPAADAEGNPRLLHFPGENSGWRPMAMIAGPGEKVYIGAVSGYGLLGGPLCVLDPPTGRVDVYPHLVPDQSVVALAALPDGCIVGGTTVEGGGGSHPTQSEAKLFLFGPEKREKLFETVPAPGEPAIQALAVGRDGCVYGFAGATLFVFDPSERKVLRAVPHGLGSAIYNAVARGPDGALIGLAAGGIFTIDEAPRRARLLARYSGRIDGGFAIRGRRVFFTSGPQIVSYTLP